MTVNNKTKKINEFYIAILNSLLEIVELNNLDSNGNRIFQIKKNQKSFFLESRPIFIKIYHKQSSLKSTASILSFNRLSKKFKLNFRLYFSKEGDIMIFVICHLTWSTSTRFKNFNSNCQFLKRLYLLVFINIASKI